MQWKSSSSSSSSSSPGSWASRSASFIQVLEINTTADGRSGSRRTASSARTHARRRKPTLANPARPGRGAYGPGRTQQPSLAPLKRAHSAPVCTESFVDRMPLVQATGTGAAYNGCLRNAETDLHRTLCMTAVMHSKVVFNLRLCSCRECLDICKFLFTVHQGFF